MKASHYIKLRQEERWIALAALLLITALNSLTIIKYHGLFSPLTDNYWRLFVGNFHISGFDPISYYVISDWEARYNVYRHPLLSFVMWLPYALNQLCMAIWGINCAQFIMAIILITAAFYAFIWLFRIFRDLIALPFQDAAILTFFFYSFAYIMLSAMVPDHFILSLCALLFTLYLTGNLLQQHRPMGKWTTIGLFVLTAGISLNNGLKTFMASLFVNGRSFFRPAHLLLAIILPALVMWMGCRYEYRYFVAPHEKLRHEAQRKAKEAREKAKAATLLKAKEAGDTATTKQAEENITAKTATTKQASESITAKTAEENMTAKKAGESATAKQAEKAVTTQEGGVHTQEKPKTARKQRVRKGAPLMQGEFMRWTDITTSRSQSVVENLFGESIQLHPDYLLQDTYRYRPMIVSYRWPINYIVETVIALLFLIGIWCGRHHRFLWLTLSWMALDMALHIGLGFGINEVYIMSAHWMFAIPIAVAYLFRHCPPRMLLPLRLFLLILTGWLYLYNGYLLIDYMLC